MYPALFLLARGWSCRVVVADQIARAAADRARRRRRRDRRSPASRSRPRLHPADHPRRSLRLDEQHAARRQSNLPTTAAASVPVNVQNAGRRSADADRLTTANPISAIRSTWKRSARQLRNSVQRYPRRPSFSFSSWTPVDPNNPAVLQEFQLQTDAEGHARNHRRRCCRRFTSGDVCLAHRRRSGQPTQSRQAHDSGTAVEIRSLHARDGDRQR